jgi:DNA-binding PadR family transcriptional regulator
MPGSRDHADHLPLRPAYFHILLTLAEAPVHGYRIRQAVEARTNGAILLAAGTLYEALQRLQRDGLIENAPAPRPAEEGASSRWRYYQATARGLSVLRLETARLAADVAAARATLRAIE